MWTGRSKHPAQEAHRPRVPWTVSATRFSVVFVGIVVALSAVALFDGRSYEGAAAWFLCSRLATLVAAIMQSFHADVVATGNEIHYGTFSCRVIPECTGIDLIGLFVAAVGAFPSSWKSKVIGLALGLPTLFALNLIRMVALVHVGSRWPSALDVAHLYVAPLIVLTATLTLWLMWAEKVRADVSPS